MNISNNIPIFIAFIAGGLAVSFTAPVPKSKENCEVYTVSRKSVTSFVLKPPHVEPLTCPPVEKCEPKPEPEAKADVEDNTIEKEEPRRRSRSHRHRVRAYWKIRHE